MTNNEQTRRVLLGEISGVHGIRGDILVRTYTATPEAGLVEPFKALALRLNVGEAGLVMTQYGWHIIVRVS